MPEPDASDLNLSPRHEQALQQFILLWGEMASDWGINRTMAQLHALLYASEQPLDTDQIMERLQISRGNANMNLRMLLDWNLVRKVHQIGSRKDYYEAEKDVWKICMHIIEERRRREIRPVKQLLESCAAQLETGEAPLTPTEAKFAERIENLATLIAVFEGFTEVILPFIRRQDMALMTKLMDFAARVRSGTPPQEES